MHMSYEPVHEIIGYSDLIFFNNMLIGSILQFLKFRNFEFELSPISEGLDGGGGSGIHYSLKI